MKQKIRVLHILSNLSIRSGVATVVMNYYRQLDKRIINFSFIYYDEVDGENYKNELNKLGAKVFYLPRKHFCKSIILFCKEHFNKYDIVHFHEPFIASFVIGIKRRIGAKKIIFHSHNTRFSDSKLKSFRNYVLSLPSRIISDYYFACSKEAGTKTFGKKFLKRGYVIYNAIDLKQFLFREDKRTEIRSALKICDSKNVIGHVGNFTPQKNHMFLIDVFNEYLKINGEAILLLVGDGYLKNDVINYVSRLGIRDFVVFTGIINNVNDYLNAMDVFLFPSLFEGLGIALIEAQVNGLKCVFSDVVPNEANICPSNNVILPLSYAPHEWAKTISIDRKTRSVCCECDAYDIAKASDRLARLYSELLLK